MKTKVALMLIGLMTASGCVPVAVGAGAAVVADSVVEDRSGGDGLF